MGAAASAGVLAAGATWRLAGIPAAGRALVAAATTGGENERTLAGMLLVRAGDRSVPVVTAAILDGATGRELPDVLGSIGTDRARAALVTLARDAPLTPQVRTAAAEALATLDAIRDLER
jgi:hypothetical protein